MNPSWRQDLLALLYRARDKAAPYMSMSGILWDKRSFPLPTQKGFWATNQSHELQGSEMLGVIPTGATQTQRESLEETKQWEILTKRDHWFLKNTGLSIQMSKIRRKPQNLQVLLEVFWSTGLPSLEDLVAHKSRNRPGIGGGFIRRFELFWHGMAGSQWECYLRRTLKGSVTNRCWAF